MRVVVVGAGIVGVCTAWALVEAGCEVVVVERNGGVAQDASYGNAGVMAPAYVTPWAAPGMPRKVLSMLFARHAPVRFEASARPRAVAMGRALDRRMRRRALPASTRAACSGSPTTASR